MDQFANRTGAGMSENAKWPLVTPDKPCPKCGKPDKCTVAPDARAGHCFRTEETWHSDTTKAPIKKIVASYNYRDEQGRVLYQSVRYLPKDFRQRQPGKDGAWVWNMKGVRLVPYMLPELIAA